MKKNQTIRVKDGSCSKGCGRPRRKGGRYCLECHRLDSRRRALAGKSEPERLQRAITKLERILEAING